MRHRRYVDRSRLIRQRRRYRCSGSSLTARYTSINSLLLSPRMAADGAISKNRQADPANGSTYRLCSTVQKGASRDNCFRLLPAQRRNGLPLIALVSSSRGSDWPGFFVACEVLGEIVCSYGRDDTTRSIELDFRVYQALGTEWILVTWKNGDGEASHQPPKGSSGSAGGM